jgi:hypothetical protein
MNITEFYTAFSEETILAIVAFVGACAFYMLRLNKIYRLRITDLELRDSSGRQSLMDDVETLGLMEDQIHSRLQSAHDHVERELVEHELAVLALNPRLRNLDNEIKKQLGAEAGLVTSLRESLQAMGQSTNQGIPDTKINEKANDINNIIPNIRELVERAKGNLLQQRIELDRMNSDLTLIKKGHGVE